MPDVNKEIEDLLMHRGIKGMRWGFNDGEPNGKRTAEEEEEEEEGKLEKILDGLGKKIGEVGDESKDAGIKVLQKIFGERGNKKGSLEKKLQDVLGDGKKKGSLEKNLDNLDKNFEKKLQGVLGDGKKKGSLEKGFEKKLQGVLGDGKKKGSLEKGFEDSFKYVFGDATGKTKDSPVTKRLKSIFGESGKKKQTVFDSPEFKEAWAKHEAEQRKKNR